MSKIPEWVWKTLAMLVIPLVAWGIKVHVDNITQAKDLTTLAEKSAKAETAVEALTTAKALQDERILRLVSDVKENEGMKTVIHQNTIALAKLETKIDGTNQTLKEILELLRKP